MHDEAPIAGGKIERYCCAIGNIRMPDLPENALISSLDCPVFQCENQFETIYNIFELLFITLSSNADRSEEISHYIMRGLLEAVLPYHPEDA